MAVQGLYTKEDVNQESVKVRENTTRVSNE